MRFMPTGISALTLADPCGGQGPSKPVFRYSKNGFLFSPARLQAELEARMVKQKTLPATPEGFACCPSWIRTNIVRTKN